MHIARNCNMNFYCLCQCAFIQMNEIIKASAQNMIPKNRFSHIRFVVIVIVVVYFLFSFAKKRAMNQNEIYQNCAYHMENFPAIFSLGVL